MTDVVYSYTDPETYQGREMKVERMEIHHTTSLNLKNQMQNLIAIDLLLENGQEVFEGPFFVDTELQQIDGQTRGQRQMRILDRINEKRQQKTLKVK